MGIHPQNFSCLLAPNTQFQTPNRHASHGCNQYVLDFSRAEVVEAIYQMIAKILQESKVSYIK